MMRGFVVDVKLNNHIVKVNKDDILDMMNFLFEYNNSEVEVVYNRKLEVLLLKTNRVSLVKIIPNNRVIRTSNNSEKFASESLYNILNNSLMLTEELFTS